MSVIGWIIFGLIVGIIAKFLMPGRDPGGFIITTLLGIAGALVGGYLGRFLGLYNEGDPVGFIMAVLGSIVLLLIYRMASRSGLSSFRFSQNHRFQGRVGRGWQARLWEATERQLIVAAFHLGVSYCSAPALSEPSACVAKDLDRLGLRRRKRNVLRLTTERR